MNVLIVYAHPEPGSFSGAMKDTAVAALTGAGHRVEVSDLYAMGFDPVLRPQQFVSRADADHFHTLREQLHASQAGSHPPDVAAEHEKLLRADLVVFQFPLWWGSMPAIMKGWIDRVFSLGTVYGRNVDALKGRKVLLAVTASGGDSPGENLAYMAGQLHHVTSNMLALPGFDILEPCYVFGAGGMTAEERALKLQEYRERLVAVAGM